MNAAAVHPFPQTHVLLAGPAQASVWLVSLDFGTSLKNLTWTYHEISTITFVMTLTDPWPLRSPMADLASLPMARIDPSSRPRGATGGTPHRCSLSIWALRRRRVVGMTWCRARERARPHGAVRGAGCGEGRGAGLWAGCCARQWGEG